MSKKKPTQKEQIAEKPVPAKPTSRLPNINAAMKAPELDPRLVAAGTTIDSVKKIKREEDSPVRKPETKTAETSRKKQVVSSIGTVAFSGFGPDKKARRKQVVTGEEEGSVQIAGKTDEARAQQNQRSSGRISDHESDGDSDDKVLTSSAAGKASLRKREGTSSGVPAKWDPLEHPSIADERWLELVHRNVETFADVETEFGPITVPAPECKRSSTPPLVPLDIFTAPQSEAGAAAKPSFFFTLQCPSHLLNPENLVHNPNPHTTATASAAAGAAAAPPHIGAHDATPAGDSENQAATETHTALHKEKEKQHKGAAHPDKELKHHGHGIHEIGVLRRWKSGKITVEIDGIQHVLSNGVDISFQQELFFINQSRKNYDHLGSISSNFVLKPDFDVLLNTSSTSPSSSRTHLHPGSAPGSARLATHGSEEPAVKMEVD